MHYQSGDPCVDQIVIQPPPPTHVDYITSSSSFYFFIFLSVGAFLLKPRQPFSPQ